jgi:hypothetical protein
MTASQPEKRRRTPEVVAGWSVGAIGVVATAISIAPSALSSTLLLLRNGSSSALPFFAAVFVVAALELAVPVFAGLAIANTRRRWYLWLVLAIVPIVIVWCIAPFFGSLGVFWGPN